MSKFPSIHCSDVGNLKRVLKKAGFVKDDLCQDEVVRMKHPSRGIAIVWRKPRNTPYQRLSPIARQVWDEQDRSRES